MNPSSSKTSSTRLQSYKHRGKDTDELRRRRNQHAVSLRKVELIDARHDAVLIDCVSFVRSFQTKRDEQVQCKRNLLTEENMSDDSDDDEDSSMDLDCILVKAQDQDLNIRYEGIRAARKMLSNHTDPPIDALIDMNFLPILVQCLTCDQHADLQFEATWALTNIASGTSQQTQAVADANALPYLLHLLHSSHTHVCEQAVWALGNLIGRSEEIFDDH